MHNGSGLPREATLTHVSHPDPLRLGPRHLTLIDDPVADALRKGDPVFGWGGDPRLALYIDHQAREWVLVRLEHDGVYRFTMSRPAGLHSGVAAVADMVATLVRTDTTKGYNPLVVVENSHHRVERERAAARREFSEEAADRLAHAFRKDGVL